MAASVQPIIRPLNHNLEDIPENAADDYYAVPLLEGRAAAGYGGVVWQQVKSLVWVYRPELGRRRNLFALRVAGDSMVPAIPDGAIVIIDRDDCAPVGKRKNIWAFRTEDGDTVIKRFLKTKGGTVMLMSDNVEYSPLDAWTKNLKELCLGKVIWMWRSLL